MDRTADTLIINPTAAASLVVHCRVRGRGPIEIELPVGGEVDAEVTRAVLELLLRGAGSPVPADLDAALVEELRDAGALIRPEERTPPDPAFTCPVDATLPPLLPAVVTPRPPSPSEPLEVAPELHFDGPPHSGVMDWAPVAAIDDGLSSSTVWARDPGPQTWMPYVLDAPSRAALDAVRAGAPLAAAVRGEHLASLALAHVVGRPGFAAERRAAWLRKVDEARAQIERDSYTVFREFLHPIELAALRAYYRGLHDAEAFIPGDGQVQQRDWIHNEGVARFMHRRLLGTVNAITPDPLQPSYSYTARYHPGAVLRRHTDRPQCEWNASLVIDTAPEVGREDAWPIWLEPPSGPTSVQLAMGDFVLYRGTRIPHWRDAQPEGRTTTVCFFHFVGTDFIGPLA